MIVPQAPPLPVFIPGEAVAAAEMAAQRLATTAAIETSHIVVPHRSPHRHSRSQNLCWLNLLSKLTERPMY
jgi:hypothetical protein